MKFFKERSEKYELNKLNEVFDNFDNVVSDTLDVIPLSLSDIIDALSSNKETDADNAALTVKLVRLICLYKKTLKELTEYIIAKEERDLQYQKETTEKINKILRMLEEQEEQRLIDKKIETKKKGTNEQCN